MTKYCRETRGVLFFGTDGEENLYNTMAQAFGNAKHLRCDIHLKDNVKRKLNDLGITGSADSGIVFALWIAIRVRSLTLLSTMLPRIGATCTRTVTNFAVIS